MTIKIWTDGSCNFTNPGPVGWAAIIYFPDGTKRIVQNGYSWSTNNRAEMMAAIDGLRSLQKQSRVILYSDSMYLVKGASTWINSWLKNGEFKKSVKNQDLWLMIHSLSKKHYITFQHVRGHSGIPENEEADQLASIASMWKNPPDPAYTNSSS